MARVNLIRGMASALGFGTRPAAGGPGTYQAPTVHVVGGQDPDDLAPRERKAGPGKALTLPVIYRAVQVHATSIVQMPVALAGAPDQPLPGILTEPEPGDPTVQLAHIIEHATISLALDGNAFWYVPRTSSGAPAAIRPLPPAEVTVTADRDAAARRRVSYSWASRTFAAGEIVHMQLMRVPGKARGLGPIQAAQLDVRGALDARDYGALWLSESRVPDGILTTDQELGAGEAEAYRNVWYGRNPDGTTPSEPGARSARERLRVLGKGLAYRPMMLKPSDVQFLESQRFSTMQLARLMGAPATALMLGIEGSANTYANIEVEWLGYVRFSLMAYIRELEAALTRIIGRPARFDTEAFLRADTATRYATYKTALEAGWLRPDEVRHREGLAPLPTPTTPEPAHA